MTQILWLKDILDKVKRMIRGSHLSLSGMLCFVVLCHRLNKTLLAAVVNSSFPPMTFSTELFRIKVNLWQSVFFQSGTWLRLCFGNKVLKGWTAGTSRLWFQTKAAPELWMVVSSGSGFLGKRRGCCTRLSGADGSPHRVPVGAPPRQIRDRQEKYAFKLFRK